MLSKKQRLLKSQTQLPLAPGTPAYPQGKEL